MIDISSYFEKFEHLFRALGVPNDLQFLRQYLNERAMVLITRVNPARATDYAFAKAYVLHQFELCRQIYLGKFNTIFRQYEEIMMLLSARFLTINFYYWSSKYTEGNFDEFFSLLIADRIKQTVIEGCLRHN